MDMSLVKTIFGGFLCLGVHTFEVAMEVPYIGLYLWNMVKHLRASTPFVVGYLLIGDLIVHFSTLLRMHPHH